MGEIVVNLHPAQAAFCRSPALYRGFVGGIGCGKSFVCAYDLLTRAQPEKTYMVICPTYVILERADLQMFLKLAREFGFLNRYSITSKLALLGNGARVYFASAEDPEKLRGPNLSGIVLAEASLMKEVVYSIAIGRLREGGVQGWLSAGFTPKGRGHWTFGVFGCQRPDTAMFSAKTEDNPFLPEAFAAGLRAQYPSSFAEQELSGKFVDLGGTVAQRQWFKVAPAAPANLKRRVRAWDFAATPADADIDGDYTAGVLMAETGEGEWIILDCIRQRVSGGSIAALVRTVAQADGKDVEVLIEQEPGSSGKIASAYITRQLAGFSCRSVVPSRDKMSRALPFLAQAEAGNISLLRGEWNLAWLDEICSFPSGAHDDQLDATAHAFNALAQRRYVGISVG